MAIKINLRSFRCRNLDRNYFKRWLLRETPQEKMDIKLLQTFKKINMQSAMKVHDTSKGLVPAPSSSAIHTSPSGSNLRPESTFANVSQLLAAKFVDFHLLMNNHMFWSSVCLVYQITPYRI